MSRLSEIRAQVETETARRWYADGAEVSLRRLFDRLALAEAECERLRVELEQVACMKTIKGARRIVEDTLASAEGRVDP